MVSLALKEKWKLITFSLWQLLLSFWIKKGWNTTVIKVLNIFLNICFYLLHLLIQDLVCSKHLPNSLCINWKIFWYVNFAEAKFSQVWRRENNHLQGLQCFYLLSTKSLEFQVQRSTRITIYPNPWKMASSITHPIAINHNDRALAMKN